MVASRSPTSPDDASRAPPSLTATRHYSISNPYPPSNASASTRGTPRTPTPPPARVPAAPTYGNIYCGAGTNKRKRTLGLVSVQRSLNESWDRTRDKVYGVNLGGCRRRGAAATRYVWRDVWLTRWARQVIWGARVKACPPALATISNGAGGARLCALGDAQMGPRRVGLLGTQLVGLLRPAFSTLGAV
ncbi:hypothetical protein C8J57DRAFT_1480597 [Mycena rebaudengoi]|nr:hypothetical protein C8J57DRAFT_1480597 [Mycena rebaudengoi]